MAITKYGKVRKICKKHGLSCRKNLVSKNKYAIKCPRKFSNLIGITIHNTDNKAPARNEIAYMIGNNSQTSFHWAVDDKEAVLGIPMTRHAWHAGDGGSGKGNLQTIAIEICYSTGTAAQFKKAEENAAILTKAICEVFKWSDFDKHVFQHYHWSGKDCPHRTRELGWSRFLKMIKEAW